MMDIQVAGATNFFCNNELVVKPTISPELTLKKKHNAIAYHRAHEAQAVDVIRYASYPPSFFLFLIFDFFWIVIEGQPAIGINPPLHYDHGPLMN
jgi:hypothetical protein